MRDLRVHDLDCPGPGGEPDGHRRDNAAGGGRGGRAAVILPGEHAGPGQLPAWSDRLEAGDVLLPGADHTVTADDGVADDQDSGRAISPRARAG